MPGDSNMLETEKKRQIGQSWLEKIIPNYKPPQNIEEAERYLYFLREQRKAVSGLDGRKKSKAESILNQAESELRWQKGEIEVAAKYFEGVDEKIEEEMNCLKVTIIDRAGRKKEVYQIEGRNVSEEEARIEAVIRVLAQRVEEVREVGEKVEKKQKSGAILTPEDEGRYHAVRLISDYAHPVVVCQKTGASKRVSQAFKEFEKLGDDLNGLDSSPVKAVLEKEMPNFPEQAQLAALGKEEAVAKGLKREKTTFLGGTIAKIVKEVVEDIAGQEPSTELERVNLEKAAEKRIDELLWKCAQNLVRSYELGENGKTGGLAGLRAEMRRRGVSEDLLMEPYRARGKEGKIKAVMDLDAAYRAVFEGQVGEFVPGTMVGGQFLAGLDPERARLVIALLGPERFVKDFRPSTISDPQERKRVEKARKLFGIDPAGRDEDKYQGVAGYMNFIEWSMTNGGTYKDAEGRPISWAPGDPIDLKRITQPTSIWFKQYVMDSVDPHLSASKRLGIDPNAVIEVVLMADLAKREGIDLRKFYQRARETDMSEEALKKVAEDFCQGMRDTLKNELVGKVEKGKFSPGYLIKLASLLTAEGRLNPVGVMERLVARPWGASEEWEQLAAVEADLFKHLSGEVKGVAMELFYEVGYEVAFRDFIASLGGGKNIPDAIDLMTAKKFLYYRAKREMGLDFTNTFVQSIANFLKRSERWRTYGENLAAQYVQIIKIDGRERVILKGLPEEIRIAVLMNLGIDISQPLPDVGYSAWRKNLNYLIENARRLGYSQEIVQALRRFNGDPLRGISPKDVVLEFKWRLARAAYEKYLSLGQTMLEKEKGITIDDVWRRLKIEEDGLLSRSEYAESLVGLWGGDLLAKELERRLTPSFLEKIFKRPGLALEEIMIKFFDFIHGRSIKETEKLGFWGKIVPDTGPSLTVFLVNSGISVILAGIARAPVVTPVFRAYPILDQIIPPLRYLSEIPLQFSPLSIIMLLTQTLLPFPFSGLKIQARLFSKVLELINDELVKRRWGRILSQREVETARTQERK